MVPAERADTIGSSVPDKRLCRSAGKRAMQQWSTEQRELFDLVYAQGLFHAEVAAIFGTTANGVKLRISRLKAALTAAITQRGKLT